MIKETLNKCHSLTIRHSGESRYPLPPGRGKVGWGLSDWMPVFTGMTGMVLLQSFLNKISINRIDLNCYNSFHVRAFFHHQQTRGHRETL